MQTQNVCCGAIPLAVVFVLGEHVKLKEREGQGGRDGTAALVRWSEPGLPFGKHSHIGPSLGSRCLPHSLF